MNEIEVRQWFKEIGAVVIKGASITSTELDDKVVAMFFNALDSDLVWGFLWPIIDGMFTDETLVQSSPEFNDACTAKAINPLAIIAIVKALIDLYKMFRKD
jgi:hypothetical protein